MRLLVVLVVLGMLGGAACRRPHPGIAREATALAARAATAAAVPTATPVPTALASSPQGPTAANPAGRQGKISAGNLGVAAFGVSAGIQMWSRPGGVMAGGATMVGTVQDGSTVDVLAEETFLGQKYYQIKSGETEGWVEGRFIQVP
jgi:hypothetical protein